MQKPTPPPSQIIKEGENSYPRKPLKEADKRETFICACHSLEHMINFWRDEEDNMVYVLVNVSANIVLFRIIYK